MKIILLETVKNKGLKNQIINVTDGYGNYLIKQKKAVVASSENLDLLAKQLEQAQAEHLVQIDKAIALKNELESTILNFTGKLTPKGTLVHKITSKDIMLLLKSTFNINIDKHKIELHHNLERPGIHHVSLKLYNNIMANLQINISLV